MRNVKSNKLKIEETRCIEENERDLLKTVTSIGRGDPQDAEEAYELTTCKRRKVKPAGRSMGDHSG